MIEYEKQLKKNWKILEFFIFLFTDRLHSIGGCYARYDRALCYRYKNWSANMGSVSVSGQNCRRRGESVYFCKGFSIRNHRIFFPSKNINHAKKIWVFVYPVFRCTVSKAALLSGTARSMEKSLTKLQLKMVVKMQTIIIINNKF